MIASPEFLYLHQVNHLCHTLDHSLVPEVAALLCAMASRAPIGGVRARYEELVDKVAESLWDELREDQEKGQEVLPSWTHVVEFPTAGFTEEVEETRLQAEARLCRYPLHPAVQAFFDTNVRDYGHSSPLELTGRPAVYAERISWYTAWLLFDSPLCAGQEFSTRAVRHRDWPMCFEAHNPDGFGDWTPDPTLKDLHDGWFDLFDADVPAWRDELRLDCEACDGTAWEDHDVCGGEGCGADPISAAMQAEAEAFDLDKGCDGGRMHCRSCVNGQGEPTGKKYPFIKDPQAFRPALDRSRCLIPTTFATGCSQTGHLRAMARVVQTGQLLAMRDGSPAVVQTWARIEEAYRAALPGMADMGLREAVYTDESPIPGHLVQGFSEPFEYGRGPIGHLADDADVPVYQSEDIGSVTTERPYVPGVNEVELSIVVDEEALAFLYEHAPFKPPGPKSYIDPVFNQLIRVRFHVQCSLAVARDWHRHRSAYPWQMRLVRQLQADGSTWGTLRLHPAYRQQSPVAKEGLQRMLEKSAGAYDRFTAEGQHYRAMLTLPLGTMVEMRASGGLKDMLYMLKLRAHAHGANFEYEAQATAALALLKAQLTELAARHYHPLNLMDYIGAVE